jgi:hypothetical protein
MTKNRTNSAVIFLERSEKITKWPFSDDSFEYRRAVVAGEKIPTWIVLTPEPVPPVPGIIMATGAQEGFYRPTNKENAVGGVRHNFLTSEAKRIERPSFAPKKVPRKNPPPPVNEHGGPSPAARKMIPKMKVACPKDFFDLMITPDFIKWVTDATNRRATADGAGSGTGQFEDWVPFDNAEIYRFIGILFANGLAPKPWIDYWFEPSEKLPLFGNNVVSQAMTKRVTAKGRTI